MKKKLCSIVCLCYFVSIMLCACGRKEQGNPIRLPAREDIVSRSEERRVGKLYRLVSLTVTNMLCHLTQKVKLRSLLMNFYLC